MSTHHVTESERVGVLGGVLAHRGIAVVSDERPGWGIHHRLVLLGLEQVERVPNLLGQADVSLEPGDQGGPGGVGSPKAVDHQEVIEQVLPVTRSVAGHSHESADGQLSIDF